MITHTYSAIDIALKAGDLSDEGIKNYLSYQPRSDYREVTKIERLYNKFAVKVTFKETV